METKKISVIGSCACRDLFEKEPDTFSFFTDIRFSSIISMLSPSISSIHASFDCFIKDVKTLNGNWYKKNLINDINKTAFDALRERHGDYLILDLAESRIPLANIYISNCKDPLVVTFSTAFRTHFEASFSKNILKNANIQVINPLDVDDSIWKDTVESFVKEILSIFEEDHIILIKNMPAEEYIDSDGCLHYYQSDFHCAEIKLANILLPKLYDSFEHFCPRCKIIQIPHHAIGYELHKWGNHPFHFTQSYYDYLLECVKNLTLENNYYKLSSIFDKYQVIFDNEYNKAKLLSIKHYYSKLETKINWSNILQNDELLRNVGKKKCLRLLWILDKKEFMKEIKRLLKRKKTKNDTL